MFRRYTDEPGRLPKMTSPFKSRSGLQRIIAATGYSAKGLRAAWQHEAAFRQEVALGAILIPLAIWLSRNKWELLLLVGSILFVWTVELVNSAIEALADSVSLDHRALLGRAKDLGSAAVLLSLFMAVIVWLCVLWPT